MAVTVLFDKAGTTSTTGTSGTQTVCTIDGSSIVTGHRYFIFATGQTNGGYSSTHWRVRFGGSNDGDIDGQYTPQGGVATHKVFTQWTGVNGQDITLENAKSGSNGASWSNAYLMAIDLDSGGMVEGTDWDYIDNTTTETPHHSYGSEVNPADLTWTPDGTSDYLIMGSVTTDATNGGKKNSMRLRDITNSVTLFNSGMGGSNGSTEAHVKSGFACLAAPAATARTYRTQWRQFGAGSPGKQNANVGFIRLNKLQNHQFFNIDVNTAPTNTNEVSAGTISVAPGATGGLVVMAAAMSQVNGSNFSSYGLYAFVDRDSSQFWGTNQPYGGGSTIGHAGNSNYTGDTGGRVGAYMFEYIDGLTEDQEYEFELRYSPKQTGSNNTIRQTMLLAFSSQEFVPLPEKASIPDPGDGYVEVFITDDLAWEVNGEGTLTSDVYFGTDLTAVTNATEVSPEFKGNQATLTYEPGLLALNTTYYWRIDTNSEGGTTKGDIWSFTTTVFIELPDKNSNPSPIDNDPDTHGISAVTLSWTEDVDTLTHEVYFSEELDDVTNDSLSGSFRGEQVSTTFQVTDLSPRTTYYWRVDCVGYGGRTTGDVWSFTTVPFIVTAPGNGDKIFSVIQVQGIGRPGNGIKMEVHTDNGLIGDGYALVNSSGEFNMAIPYTNQSLGTDIRLVGVAQSVDSVELTLSLVQGRKPLGEVKTRTGRQLHSDGNTIALWHMGDSVLQKTPQGGPFTSGFGSMPKVLMNFWRQGLVHQANVNNPENSRTNFTWGRAGGPSEAWYPRSNLEYGVFNYYNFNESGYSRVSHSNRDDESPISTDGFHVQLMQKSQRPIPDFAPTAGDHTILYTVDGEGTRFRIYGGGTGYTLINTQNTKTRTLAQDVDVFDWNLIDVYGQELIPSDTNGRYLEMYVNGELRHTGYQTTASGQTIYLGQAFTTSNFVAGQIMGFRIEEGRQFIATIGTNLQGDSTRDALTYRGVNPVLVSDPEVPFDSALDFNGSTGYMYSSDSAFEPAAPFTVEIWFKTHAADTDQVIAAKEQTPTNGWTINLNSSSELSMTVANGSNNTVTGKSIVINRWYYAALVYDGTTMICYLDGKEYGRLTAGFTLNTAQDLTIGIDGDKSFGPFNGEMTQFRMSNVARSPWEIYSNYFAVDDPRVGFIEDSQTSALINFDEPEGRLVSGNSNPKQLPKRLDFDSPDQTREFFHIDDPFIFYDGDNDNNTVEVTGGGLEITLDHNFNDFTRAIPETRGKARISGDFDVTMRVEPWNRNAAQPWDNSTSRISMRLVTATNGVAYLIFDEYSSGGTYYRRAWGYLYETVGLAEGSTVQTFDTGSTGSPAPPPSAFNMRITRKGGRWAFYYGLAGNPPTIYLGNNPGPTEDCYISLDCFIATEDLSHTATCRFTNLEVKGFGEGIAIINNLVATNLNDGETFTIDDNEGSVETFEFDLGGTGVSPGNIAVAYNLLDNAGQVRNSQITAINASSLNVYAHTLVNSEQTGLWPLTNMFQPITMSDTVAHPLWTFHNWDPTTLKDGYIVKDNAGVFGTLEERPGPFGTTAVDFDGVSRNGIMADSAAFDHQDISVELWFSADTLHNGRLIERRFVEEANAGFQLDLGSDGYIAAEITDSVGESLTVQVEAAYSINTWHYIAITFDTSESTLTLYLDGKAIGSASSLFLNGTYSSDLPVYLGRTRATQDLYFDGAMGSLRISTTARTPKEIFETYNGASLKEI